MGHAASTDAELIEACVDGHLDAFTALVKRYESLVCAVSYSATGNRALSEDVAQETFVAAWNGLAQLRESSKVRGWLCGIARNLSSKALRRVGREIPSDTDVQAAMHEVTAGPSPLDDALEKESEQLVWTALQDIPETYREPLVLFYREDRSTKQVAEALGLSENAVQQRLSRGRQHLRASVADLIERTLERTKPSKGFAVGVIAAVSASAAGAADAASSQIASSASSAPVSSTLAIAGGLLTMKTLKLGAAAIVLLLLALGAGAAFRGQTDSEADGMPEPVSEVDLLSSLQRGRRDRIDPRTAPPVSASGRVVDAATGSGISGARVVLTDKALDSGATKRPGALPEPITIDTDTDGRWSIERVPYGRYLVSAAANGFLPGALKEIQLQPGRAREGLEIALVRGGELLRGTVSDVGGGPIAEAFVSATRLDSGGVFVIRRPVFATLSDDDGAFELNLGPGSYTVVVSREDYVSVSRNVDVARGQQAQQFRLVPGGAIEGHVLIKGSGQPVEGAYVIARGGPAATSLTSAIAAQFSTRPVVTDASGAFRMTGVASDSLALVARASGYTSLEPLDVHLAIAEGLSDVVLWVEPAQTVSGYVVAQEDGSPIRGALVIVSEFGSELNNHAAPSRTGDDGYFEIVGVRPGEYLASAITDGRRSRFMGKQVTVKADDVTGVVLEIARGATLVGRVEPAAAARVSLRVDTHDGGGFGDIFAALGAVFVTAETEPDGTFVLRGAPEGKFDLLAVTKDGLRGVLPVEITGDGATGLVVPIEEQASLAGRVVDERGRSMAGFRVRVQRMDGPHDVFSISDFTGGRRVWTNRAGRFEATGLEAGVYQLSVHGDRAPADARDAGFMLPFADGRDAYQPTGIVLEAHEARSGLKLRVVRSAGVIEGVVVDPLGAPMADAWVTARRIEGFSGVPRSDMDGPVLTDSAGAFRLTNLRSGSYRLTANHASSSARAQADSVRTGASVTLQLLPLGELTGHVVQGSQPVTQFNLQLVGPNSIDRRVQSESGAFTLSRLDVGTHQINITADSGTATAVIEVASGPGNEVELELADWAAITGRVVSFDTGAPMAGLSVLTFTSLSNHRQDMFGNMATGMGPKTDSGGRFRVEDLGRGKGLVTIYSGGFSGSEPLASKLFEIGLGKQLDLGEIRALSPGQDVDKDKRGYLGFEVEPGIWRSTRAGAPIGNPSFDNRDRVLRVVCGQPQRVQCRAPATDSGVSAGDEIVAINGIAIDLVGPQAAALLLRYGRVTVGQEFNLRIRRSNKVFGVTLRAIPLPAEIVDMMP